tara:strand:+ start:814 stop:1194 length:381 start_codon:yes stop_codon:yes gene_type:complete
MSWKLRRNANNASPTGVLILCCVVCFIFFPKVTIGLILIFLILQFWDLIFDERFKGGNHNPVNNPENIKSIYKRHKKNAKYKLNASYKFDSQKFFPKDSNSEQRGSRGGRFRIRYNKDGKPYRQYY